MLTLPKIVEYGSRPYVAIPLRVKAQGGVEEAGARLFAEIWQWVRERGVEPGGMSFIRYRVIDMKGWLELEFGVSTAKPAEGDGRVVAGALPAGRYATVSWTGPYDALLDVNAVLIGWAREKGIRWDVEARGDGDHFACRYEDYPTDPAAEPDRSKWVTHVAIKIAD